MPKKTQQYNLDEAISYVFKLGSKSEMSELDDSCDEDYEPEIIDRNGYSEEEEEENEKEPEELPENENEQEIEEVPEEEREKENGSEKASKTKKANVKSTYRWRIRELAVYDIQFKGQEFSAPPENAVEITLTQYFSRF